MRNTFFLLLSLGSLTLNPVAHAQEPVLIAGGSTPPTPVMTYQPAVPAVPAVATVPVAAVPVVYVPVAAPVVYPYPGYAAPLVAGGCYPAPNVIYFGGPNSCYNNSYYNSYYRPGCSYSPSVIYFGRGEACQRGYAFRHPR